uniref:Metalloendopeptidase n=1 Tax=Meloidogyne hapla TaxID=6305 RepID=A0A1I8AX41_MELHA
MNGTAENYILELENIEESSKEESNQIITFKEPAWMRSGYLFRLNNNYYFSVILGKFQGDIDGVDEILIKQLSDPNVQFNALKNRQLTWSNGIVPYELDDAFSLGEVRLLQRAFRTYRRCYSQVGKTGGKQELSLGQGCLFNETIIHELMHSLGFWHEHSRADRDNHIIIRWENILPGLDSQFDIVSLFKLVLIKINIFFYVSSAIQDTLDEPYDYKSIMHYGSSAFSKNGRNTLEAVIDEFTNIIGTSFELSELDISKIMKLYRCKQKSTNFIKKRKINKNILTNLFSTKEIPQLNNYEENIENKKKLKRKNNNYLINKLLKEEEKQINNNEENYLFKEGK